MEQVIYSRFEYPIGDEISHDKLFAECNSMYPRDIRADGLQIGGVSVAIRCTPGDKAVILLAYDEASAVFLTLKLKGQKGLLYTNLRK